MELSPLGPLGLLVNLNDKLYVLSAIARVMKKVSNQSVVSKNLLGHCKSWRKKNRSVGAERLRSSTI